MARKRLVGKLVSNTAAALGEIRDLLASAGWTTHDDQITAGKYLVMKAPGETAGNLPVYIEFNNSVYADNIYTRMYTYWNATTHAGVNGMYYSSYGKLPTDDDGSFYLWVYANKDWATLVTKKLSGNYYMIGCGMAKRIYAKPLGVLQNAAGSGTSVTLTLASGETDGFVAGDYYQIVGNAGEGTDRVLVDSVDAANDQITINNLPRNYGSGSQIGIAPFVGFIWYYLWSQDGMGVSLPYNASGTGAAATGDNLTKNNMVALSHEDPNTRTGKVTLVPITISDGHGYFLYLSENHVRCNSGTDNSFENTLSVGCRDKGTSSGSNGSATLNDTGKSWSTDQWAGKAVIITAGTGAGQMRAITANTSTALTVDENWTTTPDDTSEYTICDEAWRLFQWTYGYGVREV